MLARSTGVPVHCFYVACDRAWQLSSWDAMLIPKPFARVHYHFDAPLPIRDDETGLSAMQASLESTQQSAEAAFHSVQKLPAGA